MEESFPAEHGSELLWDPLEELLDGGRVADKRGSHLQSTGRNVTHSDLHVVRDPLNEVAAVLVLDIEELFVDLLHGHPAPEDGGDGEVSAVARVAGSHHVLGVKHLLGQLRNGQCSEKCKSAIKMQNTMCQTQID